MKIALGIISILISGIISSCNNSFINKSNATTPVADKATMLIMPKLAIRTEYDMQNGSIKTDIAIALNNDNNVVKSAIKGTQYIITAQAFDSSGKLLSSKEVTVSQEIDLFKQNHEIGAIEITNNELIDSGFIVVYVDGVKQNETIPFYLYNRSQLIKYNTKEIVFSPEKKVLDFTVSLNQHYTDHDADDTQYEVTAQLLDYNHEIFSEAVITTNNKVILTRDHLQDVIKLEYKNYMNEYYLQAGYLFITVNYIAVTAEQKEKVDFYSDCDPKRWEYIAVLPSTNTKGGAISLKTKESKAIRFINCWKSDRRRINLHAEGVTFSPTNYFTFNSNQAVLIQLTREKPNSETCVSNVGDKDKYCWINIVNV